MEPEQLLPWDLMGEKWSCLQASEDASESLTLTEGQNLALGWVEWLPIRLGLEFVAGNRLVDFCQLNDLDKLEGILLLGSPRLPVAQSWHTKCDGMLPAGLPAALGVQMSAVQPACMQPPLVPEWGWRGVSELSIHVLCCGPAGMDFSSLADLFSNSTWFFPVSWIWNQLQVFNWLQPTEQPHFLASHVPEQWDELDTTGTVCFLENSVPQGLSDGLWLHFSISEGWEAHHSMECSEFGLQSPARNLHWSLLGHWRICLLAQGHCDLRFLVDSSCKVK